MSLTLNEKNRNIIIYILLTIFFIGSLIYLQFNDFVFEIKHNVLFGVVSSFIAILISIKANNLYNQTADKRLAILSGGFLLGAIFEILHFIYSAYYGIWFYYWYLEAASYALGLIIPVFYTTSYVSFDAKQFKSKTFKICLIIFSFAIIIEKLTGESLLEYILFNLPLSNVSLALFLTAAFVYADLRNDLKLNPFSPLVIGLVFMALGEFYIQTQYYTVSEMRYLVHLEDVIGLVLIYIGVNEIDLNYKYFSIKQKFLLFSSAVFLFFYLVIMSYFSLFLGIKIPDAFRYFFLVSFIALVISEYFLSIKLTQSISNIVKAIEKSTPGRKVPEVKKITNDEIGLLTDDYNKNLKLMLNYTEEIDKKIKREELLRKIIDTIRSSLDVDKTLEIIAKEIVGVFNVQRVNIVEYPEKGNYNVWEIKQEYKVSESIKGVKDLGSLDPQIPFFYGQNTLEKDRNVVCNNIKESNTPEFFKDFYGNLGMKAVLSVPIKKDQEKWGVIVLGEYYNFRDWKKDEIDFLQTIASQIFIALKQAELYSETKKKAERESLLRKIFQAIRSSLNIDEVLTVICDEVAKTFDVQRATITHFLNPDNLQEYVIKREYRKNKEVKAVTKLDFDGRIAAYWGKELFEKNIFMFCNIKDLDAPEYFTFFYKDLRVKSAIGCSIRRGEDKWGMVVLSEYNYYRHWTDEEIDLLKMISDQIYSAIYQAELYETTLKQAEREKTLRKIISTINQTLDINKVKNIIVNEMGKIFKADRCVIRLYDKEKHCILPVDEYSEYRVSSDIKTLINVEHPKELYGKTFEMGKEKDYFIIDDVDLAIDEYGFRNTNAEKFYKENDFVSMGFIYIKYQNEILGNVGIHWTKEIHHFSDDEIEFLRVISEQVGTVIYQAKLYEKIKLTVKREQVLRKIVATINQTLDINKVKESIVTQVGKAFAADRCVIRMIDEKKQVMFDIEEFSEYRSSPEVKSLLNTKYPEEYLSKAIEMAKERDYVVWEDVIKTAEEYGYRYTSVGKYYEDNDFISMAVIYIKYQNEILGNIGIHWTKEKHTFSEDEITFLEVLAEQVGTAIYQSKLFDKANKSAQREALIRRIIETLRKSIDINEMKQTIVTEIGQSLKIDRCFVIDYDETNNKFLKIDNEFLSSKDIKTMLGFEIDKEIPRLAGIFKRKIEVVVSDVDQYLIDNNLENNREGIIDREYNIKSAFALPILYYDKLLGVLVLHSTIKKNAFRDEEILFVRTLADQVGIALYQAKLYSSIKESAQKEALLREIISKIKLSENLDQAYNYVLEKISEIFNSERTFFIELSSYKYEKSEIKYEYLRDKNINSIKGRKIPDVLSKVFSEINKELEPIIINSKDELYLDDLEVQNFFNHSLIKALMAMPLIRYNHDTKILGILCICSSEKKEWSTFEIDLLLAIAESIVNVIWEISKLIEIDDLRNTFILTLGHDLQVPLVGEHRALEFLVSRPENEKIGKYLDLLKETLINNEEITKMLKRMIDSYNYQASKKVLELKKNNISELIKEVLKSLETKAKEKNIEIFLDIEEGLPEVVIDKGEIKKVIFSILENAIVYIQQGGVIEVKCYISGTSLVTSVSDNGPGISFEVRGKLFERYAMAQVIERKIGAGMSLYLAKQIVEAHNGEIWYTTEEGKGSEFCFSLPFDFDG